MSCLLVSAELHPAVTRTYEQAAVGASIDGQFGGRGVSLLDEILSRTLEVCETVLLAGQHAGWERGDKGRHQELCAAFTTINII